MNCVDRQCACHHIAPSRCIHCRPPKAGVPLTSRLSPAADRIRMWGPRRIYTPNKVPLIGYMLPLRRTPDMGIDQLRLVDETYISTANCAIWSWIKHWVTDWIRAARPNRTTKQRAQIAQGLLFLGGLEIL